MSLHMHTHERAYHDTDGHFSNLIAHNMTSRKPRAPTTRLLVRHREPFHRTRTLAPRRRWLNVCNVLWGREGGGRGGDNPPLGYGTRIPQIHPLLPLQPPYPPPHTQPRYSHITPNYGY